MIRTLLWRLHQHPEATFDEQDLRTLGEAISERLKSAGVLASIPIDASQLAQATNDGRLLEAVDDGEHCELIDPDDVDFDPIPVDVADLRRWRVDLDRLARLLQKTNRLDGACELVSPRLLLLGRSGNYNVVLALSPSWAQAREPVLALQWKLGSSLIVGSMASPPPTLERLELASRQLRVVGLGDDGRLAIEDDVERAASPTRRMGRRIGRGVGSLLDCWIECHQLHSAFPTIQQFYAAAHEYLRQNPADVASGIPGRERFPSLRYNGQQLRQKAGRCVWHRCTSPPDPSYLVSY